MVYVWFLCSVLVVRFLCIDMCRLKVVRCLSDIGVRYGMWCM